MNVFTKSLIVLGIAFFSALLIVTAAPSLNYTQMFFGVGIGIVGFWVFGRGRGKGRGERIRVGYDFITATLMGVFFLSIIFSNLGGIVLSSQSSVNIAEFLISFWAGGVIMGLITLSITFRAEIGQRLFTKAKLYIVLSFAMFFLANAAVPPTVPVFLRQSVLVLPNGGLSSSGNFVVLMISVPEETVMRGWIAPWLANISHTGILGGTIGSAIIFMVFHLFVYGTSPANLLVIFVDGLVQGFVTLKTRVLAISLFMHLSNNFLSVNGL